MTKANRILNRDLSSGRFLTVFFGVLDPASGELTYVSAGQAPLLHFRNSEDKGDIITSIFSAYMRRFLTTDSFDEITY